MNTTPDKQETTRLQRYLDEGAIVNYPHVQAMYLVNYLWALGSCASTGMGLISLSWQEIESWQRQNGIEFRPFELKILKQASGAYAQQVSISSEPNCPPPIKPRDEDPEKLDKHIKNILR